MSEVDRMAVIERIWTWYRPNDRAWGLCTDEQHAESLRKYPDTFEVTEYVAADQLRGAVEAGDRLAVMLNAFFRYGYGTPEHEDRCREALRVWDAARRGQ